MDELRERERDLRAQLAAVKRARKLQRESARMTAKIRQMENEADYILDCLRKGVTPSRRRVHSHQLVNYA